MLQNINLPPVVKNIIIINILMLLGVSGIGTYFDLDLNKLLALHSFKSEYFMPHQLITHMFMHANISHLFFNMFAVYMFGRTLEYVWGSKRFMIYYFATGLGAVILHSMVNWIDQTSVLNTLEAFKNSPSPELLTSFLNENIGTPNPKIFDFINRWGLQPDNEMYISEGINIANMISDSVINTPTVGASGAVFGILLAFGMLFPNTEIMLLIPPIPIKAKYFVMGYGAIELYLGLQSSLMDNVAHFAHLGGMLFGYLLIIYWKKNSDKFY